ncbi:Photox toxin [compost metagenome]
MPKHVGRTNRGMSLQGEELKQALSTYRPGAIVEENGFTSTSTASGFGGNVRVVVNGKSGVDVAGISHYASEAEILFMPGTRFRVDQVVNEGGSYRIELTEI